MLKTLWRDLPRADRAKLLAGLICGVLALLVITLIDLNCGFFLAALCGSVWGSAEILYAQRQRLLELVDKEGARGFDPTGVCVLFFLSYGFLLLFGAVAVGKNGISVQTFLLSILLWAPFWALFLTAVSFLLRGFSQLSRYIETCMGDD